MDKPHLQLFCDVACLHESRPEIGTVGPLLWMKSCLIHDCHFWGQKAGISFEFHLVWPRIEVNILFAGHMLRYKQTLTNSPQIPTPWAGVRTGTVCRELGKRRLKASLENLTLIRVGLPLSGRAPEPTIVSFGEPPFWLVLTM